ncbi:MAG: UbiA family prenyltransferase [Gemmatales bacterium]
MFKAWAQLVRLPNVFTAPADVLAGAGFALIGFHGAWPWPSVQTVLLLCAASICFYSGGMILNDVFDYVEDKRDRPFRPLPSGRIGRSLALRTGLLLLIIGITLALLNLPLRDWWPYGLPIFLLPIFILAYNLGLKATFLGPLVMGLCRGLNLLLGATVLPEFEPLALWAAMTVTIYITGVTSIARDEVNTGQRKQILYGSVLILLAFISLSVMWFNFNLNVQKGKTEAKVIIAFLMAVWMGVTLVKLSRAIRLATPEAVQSTIKFCIMGLIALETIHLMFSIGLSGLLLLLLLIPALFLGRFIYST